ncbi:MAG: pyridoxamine 5'-phosphate oxidase family protein, partial [Desulfuromonadaceae bacterium]
MERSIDLNKIRTLLDDPAHLCTLSTVDADGIPNSAVFGSVQLRTDEITLGLGENHTLHNLRQNPDAMLMLMVPGASVMAFRGMRLYLQCSAIETSGPLLEQIKDETREQAGRAAAQMLKYAVT